ncbi:MAG: anti-sigma factor, partial [Ilumatobacteraceae bacterium]
MNPRIDDLIALAALGELTADEAAELDAAAEADPTVARELADALDCAAALQTSTADEPPPALRGSVLAAIAGLPQIADDDGPPAIGDSPRLRNLEPAFEAGNGTGVPEGLPNVAARRRRFAPVLAAAAVLALVVGGALIATNSTSSDDDPIAAVVEADDAESHSLSGTIGELQLVYSPAEEAFVLVGDSLEAPPADSTYQIWLVTDGEPTSFGTFEPDDAGAMEIRADGVD